jgi:hypothetical protein
MWSIETQEVEEGRIERIYSKEGKLFKIIVSKQERSFGEVLYIGTSLWSNNSFWYEESLPFSLKEELSKMISLL